MFSSQNLPWLETQKGLFVCLVLSLKCIALPLRWCISLGSNHAFELLISEYSVSMCDARVCFPLVNLFFVSLIYRVPARKAKMGRRKRFLFRPLESQPMYNTTSALWLKSFCLTNIYWALCTQTRAGAVGHSPDPHRCLAELWGGELRQASDFSKER